MMTKSDIANVFAVPTTLLDRKDSNSPVPRRRLCPREICRHSETPAQRVAINQFLVSEYDSGPMNDRQLFVAYDKPLGLENMAAEFARARTGPTSVHSRRTNFGISRICPTSTRWRCAVYPNTMTPVDPKTGMPVVVPGRAPVAPTMTPNGKRVRERQ